MKQKERYYVTSLAILLAVMIIACIISFVLGFKSVIENQSINNNIFEIIYMTFHLIFTAVCFIFCISALKGNSYHILRNMMYKRYNQELVSKPAMIIMGIFAAIGLATGVYFTLVLANVAPNPLDFPIFLRLILVNTPYTIFIIATYFICYPLVYKK